MCELPSSASCSIQAPILLDGVHHRAGRPFPTQLIDPRANPPGNALTDRLRSMLPKFLGVSKSSPVDSQG